MFSILGFARGVAAETTAREWATASGATFVPEMESSVANYASGGDFGMVSGYYILSVASAEASSVAEALALLGPPPAGGNLVSAAVVNIGDRYAAAVVLLNATDSPGTEVPDVNPSTTTTTTTIPTPTTTQPTTTQPTTTQPSTTQPSTTQPLTTLDTSGTTAPEPEVVQVANVDSNALPSTTTTVSMTGSSYGASDAESEQAVEVATETANGESREGDTVRLDGLIELAVLCLAASYLGAVIGRRR